MSKKLIIITGVAGFIGSHLRDTLIESNSDFIYLEKIPLDTTPDYFYNLNEKEEYYTDIGLFKGAILSKINSKEYNKITFYHLASTVGPENILPENIKDDYILNYEIHDIFKEAVLAMNSNFTQEILSKSNKTTDKYKIRFYYTSSSEVYQENEIFNENENIIMNTLPEEANYRKEYTHMKLAAENLFLSAGKALSSEDPKNINPEVVILRLFNIVGPRQKPGFVISNFREIFLSNLSLLKKEGLSKETIFKFPVFGDGEQSRSFTSVADLMEVFLKLEALERNPKALKVKNNKVINDIINIANPKNSYTIKEMAYLSATLFLNLIENLKKDILLKTQECGEIQEDLVQVLHYLERASNELSKDDFIEYLEVSKDRINHIKRTPLIYKMKRVLKAEPKDSIERILLMAYLDGKIKRIKSKQED